MADLPPVPDEAPPLPRSDEALIAAATAGQRLAFAWVGFLSALDDLEAANRAAKPDAAP